MGAVGDNLSGYLLLDTLVKVGEVPQADLGEVGERPEGFKEGPIEPLLAVLGEREVEGRLREFGGRGFFIALEEEAEDDVEGGKDGACSLEGNIFDAGLERGR
jgi:hypothetical protein